jgi:hypothetical protein
MKILVNGCSHSACARTQIANIKNKLVLLPESKRPSWVTKLSDDLNLKNLYSMMTPLFNKSSDRFEHDLKSYLEINSNEFIVTLAEDGKGNDSIFMDTISTLYNFKKLNIKLDFVIVQWSGPSRKLISGVPKMHPITSAELLIYDGIYRYANPHEYYEFGLNLEPAGSWITLNNMMILQNYLKDNNINYAFLNYFPLDSSLENSFAFKELDLGKFLVYKNNHPIFDGWIESIKKDNLSIDKDGHPNEELQQIIADKVREQINLKRNLN